MRVLDGDGGLIGEGLKERDLPGRERAHARAPQQNHADGGAVAQQRAREDGPGAERYLRGHLLEARSRRRPQVADVDGPAVQDGERGDDAAAQRVGLSDRPS